MPDIETISWQEMTGNKYAKALHPAMVSKAGYETVRSIRRIGDAVPTVFRVIYDRQYVLDYVGNGICKTLFVLGKQGVLNLVSEAWDNYYGVLDIKESSSEESV
ncbi:hypothetical protein [Pleurocapsa sp. FMAR1]|uniref:hypothetical protein n=1 Tax=Pleurocapsa sp. FMAR1 TaxID=3040204 RepID=UPI0029C933FD|nr:hypothetical protein [Pleurocapsa sp. FMAR1]